MCIEYLSSYLACHIIHSQSSVVFAVVAVLSSLLLYHLDPTNYHTIDQDVSQKALLPRAHAPELGCREW